MTSRPNFALLARVDDFDVDAETRALLDAYGFDAELFATWRARLRSGEARRDAGRLTSSVEPPTETDLRRLPRPGTRERAQLAARGEAAIRGGEVGAVVLAGGMATRFGGVVKAGVEALARRSFLSLKLGDVRKQAERLSGRLPVLLMSSFATHAELEALAQGEQSDAAPVTVFPQLVSLRLAPDGSLFRGDDGRASPYAPGHGDMTFALRRSGALERFLDAGGRTLFMSNVDNLAATLDPAVIGAHLQGGAQMTIEAVRRVPGDPGGAPARVGGRIQIVEDFRLPEGYDRDTLPVFNTNTFTLDGPALDRDFPLSWFAVDKRVDGRDAIQFEHLVGELSAFLSCALLEVERGGDDGRFQPAKDPEELARRRPALEALLRARGVL